MVFIAINYYSPVYDGDIVYSCDMVRFKFHICKLKSQAFLDWFWRSEFNSIYTYDTFHSNRLGTYKYLFPCSYKYVNMCCNFTLGFGLNEASHVDGANCMIEFNPNKNDMDFMRSFLDRVSSFVTPVDGIYFHLMRYDLAVDIPVERKNVVLLKQGKREYHRIISNSLTEYLGKRNSNGFVKVYDKQQESNLDNPLTRIEITCDSFDVIPLPRVVLLQDLNDDFSELNSTDIVLVNLIRGLPPDEQQYQLKCLGRTKREKLQGYIFPFEQDFAFDLSKIHWVTTWILEMMCNFQGNFDYFVDKKEEECVVKNDEVYQQFALFDK